MLGVSSAHFVGNSMGAVNLLTDLTAGAARAARSQRGRDVRRRGHSKNRHTAALYDYDATLPAMRAIVAALFTDPSYPADEAYVRRRYESSIVPGAWESVGGSAVSASRSGAAGDPVQGGAGPTSASGAGPGGGGRGGQAVAARVGGRDRRADPRRPVGRRRAGRALPQIEQSEVVSDLLLKFLASV